MVVITPRVMPSYAATPDMPSREEKSENLGRRCHALATKALTKANQAVDKQWIDVCEQWFSEALARFGEDLEAQCTGAAELGQFCCDLTLSVPPKDPEYLAPDGNFGFIPASGYQYESFADCAREYYLKFLHGAVYRVAQEDMKCTRQWGRYKVNPSQSTFKFDHWDSIKQKFNLNDICFVANAKEDKQMFVTYLHDMQIRVDWAHCTKKRAERLQCPASADYYDTLEPATDLHTKVRDVQNTSTAFSIDSPTKSNYPKRVSSKKKASLKQAKEQFSKPSNTEFNL